MKDEQVGVITLVILSFILYLVFMWTRIPLNFFEIYGIIVLIISSYIAFIKNPNQTK
jgi:hypothetical protein